MNQSLKNIPDAPFSLQNVVKTFLSREGERVRALDGVTFESAPQGITCIVGPTGSGKTTVLRTLAGLEKPDQGEVFVSGREPGELIGSIGFLAQTNTLFPWMTLAENVGIPFELNGNSRREQQKKVQALCGRMGLQGSENRFPYELSGGMRQRAALGRLLASEARYWLMDEPFASLDERSRQQLREILLRLVSERKLSVLFVTHSIDEAVFLADRVVVLSAAPGKIVKTKDIAISHSRDRMSGEYGAVMEEIRTSIEAIL